jgi:polyphosphate kinase
MITASSNVALPSLPPEVPVSTPAQVSDPDLYLNRELSWLEFNARVLAEADDRSVPLFERLKFLGIFSTNLDEFFMVRVAGLQAQLSGDIEEAPADGMSPVQQLHAISARAHELMREQYRIYNGHVSPELRQAGVALVKPDELSPDDRCAIDDHFERNVFPVLTPIAIDPSHPFPHVRNKSINLAILFERSGLLASEAYGVVQVPTTLPRLIRVPVAGYRRAFVLLEDLILRNIGTIFPGMVLKEHFAFRVTRNFDIEVDDEEAEDLLLTLQAELRRRERGQAVRLELCGSPPASGIEWLCRELDLHTERDVYLVDGPLFLGVMPELAAGDKRREHRDEPYVPQYVPPLRDSEDVFETLRERDVLLHHPYESFEAVVDFLNQAAEDPNVLAIKQTLYRTGGESPMVRALQRAAELGKQVTALVELKARFDEESNIRWARALERSGVNVMYGLLGFKTHAKVLLVVRKEANGLRRYVHLATGNYNQQTARLYEDISLFTAHDDVARDATALFNLLTGYSAPRRWHRLLVSPLGLHEVVLGLIERETAHARAGRKAEIIAKMNSLVDPAVISALAVAAQAGVTVTLLVRGICCLRPGLPGVSEGIRVHALIDRYLEHARIFYFRNADATEVYCSSADWMPRNFRRRVEVMFPILDQSIKRRVIDEILGTMVADNAKSWSLQANGEYLRVSANGSATIRSQARFMESARERAKESDALLTLSARSRTYATMAGPQAALTKFRRKKRKRKHLREDDG